MVTVSVQRDGCGPYNRPPGPPRCRTMPARGANHRLDAPRTTGRSEESPGGEFAPADVNALIEAYAKHVEATVGPSGFLDGPKHAQHEPEAWDFAAFRAICRSTGADGRIAVVQEDRTRLEELFVTAMDRLGAGEETSKLACRVGALYTAYFMHEMQDSEPKSCVYVSPKQMDQLIQLVRDAKRLKLASVQAIVKRMFNTGALMQGCVERPSQREVELFQQELENLYRPTVHHAPPEVLGALEKLKEDVQDELANTLRWEDLAQLGRTYVKAKATLSKKLPKDCAWMAKRTFRLPRDLKTIHETCVEEVDAALRGVHAAVVSSERRISHMAAAKDVPTRGKKRPTQLQRKAMSTAAYMMKTAHITRSEHFLVDNDPGDSDPMEWLDSIFGLPQAARMAVRAAEAKRRRSMDGQCTEAQAKETHEAPTEVDSPASLDSAPSRVQMPRLMSMPSIPGLPDRVQSPPLAQQGARAASLPPAHSEECVPMGSSRPRSSRAEEAEQALASALEAILAEDTNAMDS